MGASPAWSIRLAMRGVASRSSAHHVAVGERREIAARARGPREARRTRANRPDPRRLLHGLVEVAVRELGLIRERAAEEELAVEGTPVHAPFASTWRAMRISVRLSHMDARHRR